MFPMYSAVYLNRNEFTGDNFWGMPNAMMKKYFFTLFSTVSNKVRAVGRILNINIRTIFLFI